MKTDKRTRARVVALALVTAVGLSACGTSGGTEGAAPPAPAAGSGPSSPGTAVVTTTPSGDASPSEGATSAPAASTAAELPGGGRRMFPDRRVVALYGTPGTPGLGVLGEYDVDEAVAAAKKKAKEYESLGTEPVQPGFEIITTLASASAGPDGDYSIAHTDEKILPLIDAAEKNDIHVILDLQPGRSTFLSQAKLYEELLVLPHVGLALDPEWRIEPNQVHLRQIGHVEVAEVNQVVTWLADLVKENNLPQKMLILHQFQVQMLRDVNDVDQSRSEIAVLIHVDGQGPQPTKQATWRTLHTNASTVKYWGWKNFYDEDIPGPLSPSDTMTTVDPVPDFISYQ